MIEYFESCGSGGELMQGLTRGDRVPDYQRPDPQGQARMLHDLHQGLPVIVLASQAAGNDALRKVLGELANPVGNWSKFTRVAIIQDTPAQCAKLLPGGNDSITLMVDDGAVLQHLVGTPSGTANSVTIFALDSNLSVIERLELPPDGNAAEFLNDLRAIYESRPVPAASIIRVQAPALFIPRIFDRAFCDGLIALFEETGGQPSGTARIDGNTANWKPDPSVKIRRDVYLTEGVWLERVREMLMRRVLPEIKRCFNFQVTQHEVFKLIRYDETGGYFRPHRDNESRDTQHRRFAMTLNLNTGDYEGGQLRFPEFGPQLYEAGRGDAVIFSCSLLHEAMPVTRGKRYALLGFFFGEAERIEQMRYQSDTQTR
jgi:predicted 2-oxoglutarate/Fe(II)-dependent dioxygenase YbiX